MVDANNGASRDPLSCRSGPITWLKVKRFKATLDGMVQQANEVANMWRPDMINNQAQGSLVITIKVLKDSLWCCTHFQQSLEIKLLIHILN